MIFEIQGGSKQFANLDVLLEINLKVMEGEIVSIVGPSGCGKSTVLKIVAGLEQLTKGAINWNKPLDPFDIGFVFQEPTLLTWKTVLENVQLPFEIQGIANEKREQAIEALEWLGLKDFLNYYPSQLSGGMRMRVSIARALITKPKVLLLDEPFAALDEVTRFQLQMDVHRLCRSLKSTVLFVTHSVSEAAYLADRILVLSQRPSKIVSELKSPLTNEIRDMSLRMKPNYLEVVKNVTQTFYATSSAH